jgi:hypothetical protein
LDLVALPEFQFQWGTFDPFIVQTLKQKRAEISGITAAYQAQTAQARHDLAHVDRRVNSSSTMRIFRHWVLDKVIRPDVVRPIRPQANTQSIVDPQTAPFRLTANASLQR